MRKVPKRLIRLLQGFGVVAFVLFGAFMWDCNEQAHSQRERVNLCYKMIRAYQEMAEPNAVYWFVGGLVSESDGSITTCYSTGTVSGYAWLGGLVARNEGDITSYASDEVHLFSQTDFCIIAARGAQWQRQKAKPAERHIGRSTFHNGLGLA